jgi:hypothetical protein
MTVANGGCTLALYRYPSTSETVVRPEVQNWKVDANISGANASLGTVGVTSYAGLENGSFTLTNNTGSGNIPAMIPCSSTNAPSGTTCSAGNESIGVSFVLPAAGDVVACAEFAHLLTVASSSTAYAAFQIVETPNNAQTISQEGKSRIAGGTPAAGDTIIPYHVCGNFSFASAGQKTLRLFYEQFQTGTLTLSQVIGDANTNVGQRDIHWTVYPANQRSPAPIFVGSVTSDAASAERVERALINCDASSSITRQSGAWLSSVGNRSSTACAITIATGIFSSEPDCSLEIKAATPQATSVNMTSATAGTVYAANADYDGYLTCRGPR